MCAICMHTDVYKSIHAHTHVRMHMLTGAQYTYTYIHECSFVQLALVILWALSVSCVILSWVGANVFLMLLVPTAPHVNQTSGDSLMTGAVPLAPVMK